MGEADGVGALVRVGVPAAVAGGVAVGVGVSAVRLGGGEVSAFGSVVLTALCAEATGGLAVDGVAGASETVGDGDADWRATPRISAIRAL